jgi:uncharacterized protein YjdB
VKGKKSGFLGYCLIVGLLVALTAFTGACSSASTSTSTIKQISTTTTPTTPAPLLTSIAIANTSPFNLAVGSKQQFTATGTYEDGSKQDVTFQVTWSSSDPNIATISSIGSVAAVSVGNTDITASLSGIASPPVNVVTNIPGPKLVSIALSRTVVASLLTGSTQQFKATGTISDGTVEDITTQVTWASSDPTIATISATGLTTGIAPGKATITATLSDVTSLGIVLTVIAP